MNYPDIDIDEPIFSPLTLLYSAYADQQPLPSQIITDHYQEIDVLLSPLPAQERQKIYQAICQIYCEKERLAFLSGIRAGARLVTELACL